MSELKSYNSNISVIQHSNLRKLKDINDNLFHKTKVKLFHGPNLTPHNKENLGSIPHQIEKTLVKDKKVMSKIGFSTTERFFPKMISKKKHKVQDHISQDLDFTRTNTSFYSSKRFW